MAGSASEHVTADAASLALIERARAGDATAFEVLIEARFWRLTRLALSITGREADARDAVQDGCLRAWRDLPGLRDPSRFEAWLWRIVINSCRNVVRSRRRVGVHEIGIDPSPSGQPGDRRSGAERRSPAADPGDAISEADLIRRAFERLDADKRSILILHHVEERPVGDIAHLLQIPEGTVKWRLFSARRALTRALTVERR